MSDKKDILIVGTLSIALFTGFTAYTHVTAKRKPVAVPSKPAVSSSINASQSPAVGKKDSNPSTILTQNQADTPAAPPTDSAPPDTARKKNTKTKAS